PKYSAEAVIRFADAQIKFTSVILPFSWLIAEAAYIDVMQSKGSGLALQYHCIEVPEPYVFLDMDGLTVSLSQSCIVHVRSVFVGVITKTDRVLLNASGFSVHIAPKTSPISLPPILDIAQVEICVGRIAHGDALEVPYSMRATSKDESNLINLAWFNE